MVTYLSKPKFGRRRLCAAGEYIDGTASFKNTDLDRVFTPLPVVILSLPLLGNMFIRD